MIDAFTQDGQVSIEYAVVERAQFDLNHLIALHDCARQLKKGEQTFPSGLCIGWRKVLIAYSHRQVCHGHLTHGHDLILSVIELVHRPLLLFQVF